MKLILFDIDGTLISTAGAGVRAMSKAFHTIFHIPDAFHSISMARKTDPVILEEAFTKHQIVADQQSINRFKDAYFEYLQIEIRHPSTGKKIMPGIRELLAILTDHNYVIALLTGNWRKGAVIKLTHFDLLHFFKFGVFADDDKIRNKLVPVAIEKFHSLFNLKLTPDQIYVIGDTPKDIECAVCHGAVSIAVATGRYNVDELAEFKPDYCFTDFRDYTVLLALLERNAP